MLQEVPPYEFIDTGEKFEKVVRHIKDTGEAALDTETTGLDRRNDYVLFWSLCADEDSRYALSDAMLPLYDKELARDSNIQWMFTNQTFDFSMLENSGVRVPVGKSYCTLAMDWLRDENRQGQHGLKETAWDYLGLHMPSFKDTFPGRKRTESIPDRLVRGYEEDPDKALDYASMDAWATYRVFKKIKEDLEHMESRDGMNYWDYFEDVEVPFTRVLHDCCRRGIMVDVGYLDELAPAIQAEMDEFQKKINREAGHEVNLNSPIQLRQFLFEEMGLDPVEYTKGGASGNRQPSTNVTTLKMFAGQGIQVAKDILAFRELQKTKSTYVDGLRKWVDSELRIHPTMTQHVTVTGRLSSVDPNLQNIPVPRRDKFGLRSAFMPKQDHVLVVVDYEQLEMRLLAHIAQEQNMIDVINKGWDIHAGTGSLMFGHEYDDIIAAVKRKKAAVKDTSIVLTKLEHELNFAREAGKNIGFGLNYGKGAAALAAELGISVEEAKLLIEKYFTPYPRVRDFIDNTHHVAQSTGIVETICGRPRRFPDLFELGHIPWRQLSGTNRMLRARAERQSVNSIIQGSAADVAKLAMIICNNDIELRNLGVELLLQVHDELIFEVPEETVEEALPLIVDLMEHPFQEDLLVPLAVDAGVGYSWASAKA